MKIIDKFKEVGLIFVEGWKIFSKNEPIQFGATIAYFTIFSFPPLLLIIIYLGSIFINDAFLTDEIFNQLVDIFGEEGSILLRFITANLEDEGYNWYQAVMIVSVVLFLATSMFSLMQSSLNKLWRIKTDIKGGLKAFLYPRFVSILIIFMTTVLFMVSLLFEISLNFFRDPLQQVFNEVPWQAIRWSSNIISAIMVPIWFALLYKILPDAKIHWRAAMVGSFATTALFLAGKVILWHMVVERDLEDIYGITTAMVVVMLWMFYASIVFYYGAAFTKAYARMYGMQIMPRHYAYKYKIIETREDED